MAEHPLEAYLALVEIRLRAARRNARIAGAVLIAALALFFFIGLTGSFGQRELIISVTLLGTLALGFVSSRSRVEALQAVTELGQVLNPGQRR